VLATVLGAMAWPRLTEFCRWYDHIVARLIAEGMRGVTAGISVTALVSAPQTAVYFWVYEAAKKWVRSAFLPDFAEHMRTTAPPCADIPSDVLCWLVLAGTELCA